MRWWRKQWSTWLWNRNPKPNEYLQKAMWVSNWRNCSADVFDFVCLAPNTKTTSWNLVCTFVSMPLCKRWNGWTIIELRSWCWSTRRGMRHLRDIWLHRLEYALGRVFFPWSPRFPHMYRWSFRNITKQTDLDLKRIPSPKWCYPIVTSFPLIRKGDRKSFAIESNPAVYSLRSTLREDNEMNEK